MVDDLLDELAALSSNAPDPRQRPDPLVLRWFVADLRSFRDQCRGFGITDDFLQTTTGAIVECFRRLDQLPRDDPFWEGTNRRPTQYKLRDFCSKLVGDSTGNGRAHVLQAAVHVLVGHDFVPAVCEQLVLDRLADAAWPVYAALIGLHFGGYDTAPELAEFLAANRLCDGARPALNALAASGVPWVREWAEDVAKRCEGQI